MVSTTTAMVTMSFLFINLISLPMGLVLLIFGALALHALDDVNTDQLKPLLDAVKVNSLQVETMAYSVSILSILIGVSIMAIAGLGLFWACGKPKKPIQVVYTVLFVVMLMMTITLIALLFTMKVKVESELKAKMLTTLISEFKNDTTTNANSVSNAWNYMFMSFDCCAVNAVTGTTNDFDTTTWCTTLGSCQMTNSQIPKTCCINVDENNYSSAPNGCHASVNPGTYNSKGCYDPLKDKLLSHTNNIAGVVITIMVLEVLAVLFVCLVCYLARNMKDYYFLIEIKLCSCVPFYEQ